MSRGTWTRLDARRTVDRKLDLDIRELFRDGLRSGRRLNVRWSSGWGEAAVSVEMYGEDDLALIAFSLDGQPVLQHVSLERTRCHYGGDRAWWTCPACERRCAILYLLDERFTCRLCGNLTHTTSQSSRWIRTVRKASVRKAVARDRGIRFARDAHGQRYAVKPRGMHQRTFERLVAEYVCAARAGVAAVRLPIGAWEKERRDRAAALAEHARGMGFASVTEWLGVSGQRAGG